MKKTIFSLITVLILITVIIFGLRVQQPTQEVAQPQILSGTYTLVQYNENMITPGFYTFSLTEDQFSGKLCNTLNGNYRVTGNTLSVPQMISTMMFCAEPAYLMNAESDLGKILSEGASMTFMENTLILSQENIIFIFQKQ